MTLLSERVLTDTILSLGIGPVIVLGRGLIAIASVLMLPMRAKEPAFFRSETSLHEAAHTMKPHEHPEH